MVGKKGVYWNWDIFRQTRSQIWTLWAQAWSQIWHLWARVGTQIWSSRDKEGPGSLTSTDDVEQWTWHWFILTNCMGRVMVFHIRLVCFYYGKQNNWTAYVSQTVNNNWAELKDSPTHISPVMQLRLKKTSEPEFTDSSQLFISRAHNEWKIDKYSWRHETYIFRYRCIRTPDH